MRRSNGSFDPVAAVAAQERALLLAFGGSHGAVARVEALDLFRDWLLSQPDRLERLLRSISVDSEHVHHWAFSEAQAIYAEDVA